MTDFSRQRTAFLFLAGALPCLLFALFTQHAWEDWYITFRAGKHLAQGLGLVFQPGQVLHTFTSPVNVLLPALLSYLTGNTHDDAVLWLYRLASAALLGGTLVLLRQLAHALHFGRTSTGFLLALFAVDLKVIDFSINGQEAAFVVFFHALNLLALARRDARLLGIAWAGLMWSRPDSFIYIGASLAGLLAAMAFDRRAASGIALTWRQLVRATGFAVVLYGPWIAWTIWYYGTPVPHTIVAKGLGVHPGAGELARALLHFPLVLASGNSAARYLFMPIYFPFGGWPVWMAWVAKALAALAGLVWLLPGLAPLPRAASFTVFAGLYYLTYVAAFPYPWYFPAVTLYAVVSLAGLAHAVSERFAAHAEVRDAVAGVCIALVLLSTLVTLESAWQLRVQQAVIENGNRRTIGLWLHAHAHSPADTVFLECLGYIGFYSGLKMYDYPGMSSPEVVAARRRVGESWPALIRDLQPDWVVLRAREARDIATTDPGLLTQDYREAAVFDQSRRLRDIRFLPGRGYLEYDQTFVVFQRQAVPAAPSSAP